LAHRSEDLEERVDTRLVVGFASIGPGVGQGTASRRAVEGISFLYSFTQPCECRIGKPLLKAIDH